jgi:hypothetical protein
MNNYHVHKEDRVSYSQVVLWTVDWLISYLFACSLKYVSCNSGTSRETAAILIER